MKEIIYRINARKTEIAVLAILVFELCFPHISYAAEPEISLIKPELTISAAKTGNEYTLPVEIYKVKKSYKMPVTAYNSLPGQTDSTPCLTANDFNLCEHDTEDVIAANFLPFGAKVRIPELFGDRIFTVVDRMNARYYYRVDVWLKDHGEAVRLGLKYATVEVIE